ncbi:MAG: lipid-A-disaccharide synthase [Ignavibacterium sp.]
MNNKNKNILIIAGEASGDLHGSLLIHQIKAIDPEINFYGIGGDRMVNESLNLSFHINQMAFLGFVEVIKHIPFIKKVQNELLSLIKEKEIGTAILIDYPGFNLNFAKKLRKLNLKIIYYISPQIWAWGKGRIKKIKRLVDKMLVTFPFEEKLYKKEGIDCEFVGHPLIEILNNYNFLSQEKFFEIFSLQKEKDILTILPGSRLQEIEKLFPIVIEAAELIANKYNLQIVVGCASNIDENKFYELSKKDNFKIIKHRTYELIKYSKFGIIKSGTSTLEAALLGLPMVIVYKTNILSYLIGKSLINLDKIGMANIILDQKVVPELIQNDVQPTKIFNEVDKILSDEKIYNSIKNQFKNIKEILGTFSGSEKAANIIINFLNAY